MRMVVFVRVTGGRAGVVIVVVRVVVVCGHAGLCVETRPLRNLKLL